MKNRKTPLVRYAFHEVGQQIDMKIYRGILEIEWLKQRPVDEEGLTKMST